MSYRGGINGSSGDVGKCERCTAILASTETTTAADALVRLTEDCLSLLPSLESATDLTFFQNARKFLRAIRDSDLRNVRKFLCSQAGVRETEQQWSENRYHYEFHRRRSRPRAMELELLAWLLYGLPDSLDVVSRSCNAWELECGK